MTDRLDVTIGILGLWLIALFGILEIPQYLPFPFNMELIAIVTAIATIIITYFLLRAPNLVVAEPDLKQPVTELHVRFRQGGERICHFEIVAPSQELFAVNRVEHTNGES